MLRSMGANITPKAIVQAGKSIAAVHSVCREFEQETCSGSTSSSDIHNIPSFGKDFETVLKLLIDEKKKVGSGYARLRWSLVRAD